MFPRPPLVLCCSGHDPTGGAGIHADIEAVAAQGAHALSLITANTVQDTSDVRRVVAVAPILIAAQIESLLADCLIGAIKIGLVGDPEQIPYLVKAIEQTGAPAVLDPVLQAGGGAALSNARTVAALQQQLFPHVTLLTPNAAEARRLAPGVRTLEECARTLLDRGCSNVLVTGGDEPGETVVNLWLAADGALQRYEWPRIAARFHGAGCTLAASIAARLACGDALAEAIEVGQRYTQAALGRALAVGAGRPIPGRQNPARVPARA